MITSLNNAKIKHLKELEQKARTRNKENLFVAEGFKMFMEAPDNLIKEVYVEEGTFSEINDKAPSSHFIDIGSKIDALTKKGVFTEIVSTDVFKKASDTESPQGIIFVMEKLKYELDDVCGKNLLVLEDIQDPGNLGTMIRTAEGAGASGVIMSKNTVDIYNPKVVRATMGSLYRVPFLYTDDLLETIDEIREKGYKTYAAHLKGKVFYDEIDYGLSAFLIGNEGNGLSDETAAKADEYIKIPMEGKLESLNAAISAAILMYNARNSIK